MCKRICTINSLPISLILCTFRMDGAFKYLTFYMDGSLAIIMLISHLIIIECVQNIWWHKRCRAQTN